MEEKILRFYNIEDAPKDSTFLYKKIERSGMIDLSVPSYDVLKTNEKFVYFFKLNDFELRFCSNCFQMTNQIGAICQKCKK